MQRRGVGRCAGMLIAGSLLGGCRDVSASTAPGTLSSSVGVRPSSELPPTHPDAGDLDDGEVSALGLSSSGEQAVTVLAKTDTFGGWAVGAAGVPTEQVSAIRTLWKEKNAPRAFELVLAKGTLAGQLMALAGLYDTDPAAFAAALPRYRGIRGNVNLETSGCLGGEPADAATIVEAPNGVRLQGPGDTVDKWLERNPRTKLTPHMFDIAGGAYTASMRPR